MALSVGRRSAAPQCLPGLRAHLALSSAAPGAKVARAVGGALDRNRGSIARPADLSRHRRLRRVSHTNRLHPPSPGQWHESGPKLTVGPSFRIMRA